MKTISLPFRPKARIMELLGEQLIKNHTLALFELVKNSYDADATEVKLTLNDIDTENGTITIRDNGLGMDFKTVSEVWMEPAHGHKLEKRNSGERTDRGRLQVGEKGVGRFAVHRLGTKITMVTRTKGCPEVVVKIDWDEFSKAEYLDQAAVRISERTPLRFLSNRSGTYIKISNLKQIWKRGDIRKLYRSVKAMTHPPLDLESSEQTKDKFEVEFISNPDKGWTDDLFDPELAESQSLFSFDFSLDNNGLSYTYKFTPYESIKADYKGIVTDRIETEFLENFDFFRFRPPEDGENGRSKKKRPERPLLYSKSKSQKSLSIGPIRGRLIGFDFDPEIMRYIKDETGGLEDYVKQQGGVRVYRDGLRIYNYGEPGDDWLGLDHRRIQGPTRKFGNKQIISEVHLSLNYSQSLQEKTNREGFVENDAYKELVYALVCIISQFEAERNKDKRRLKNALSITPGTTPQGSQKKKSTDDLIVELEHKVTANKELDAQIGNLVRGVGRSYRETRDAMLSAAGAGLGLVTVFHELERGIRGLNKCIIDGVSSELLKDMSNELVSILQGAMYMVSNRRMEEITASQLVKYALLTQQRRFKRHKVTFLDGFQNMPGKDFKIKGMRRMLTAALVNIIDNAIYWMDDESAEKYIWVAPSDEFEGPAIMVADSGPGFIDQHEDLVQPFYTRKPEGMGMGLYYADMVMKSHGGRLVFPIKNSVDTPNATNGACVGLIFKKEYY